jgi:hypothetical protein
MRPGRFQIGLVGPANLALYTPSIISSRSRRKYTRTCPSRTFSAWKWGGKWSFELNHNSTPATVKQVTLGSRSTMSCRTFFVKRSRMSGRNLRGVLERATGRFSLRVGASPRVRTALEIQHGRSVRASARTKTMRSVGVLTVDRLLLASGPQPAISAPCPSSTSCTSSRSHTDTSRCGQA